MKFLKKINAFLMDLPPIVFWVLFFLIPSFFTISKIIGWDLWWHISCGRYIWENGVYPSPATFSFTPVREFSVNSFVWLGDLFFYTIYKLGGGVTGLQIFKFLIVSFPAFIIYLLSGKKRNVWVLFMAYIAIVGTLQMHSFKNAMFGLFFLPFLIWLYVNIEKNGKLISFILMGLVFTAWTFMHGYVQVGISILALCVLGHFLDGILEKDRKKLILSSLMVLSCFIYYQIVAINYPIGFSVYLKSFFSTKNISVNPPEKNEPILSDGKELSIIDSKANIRTNDGDSGVNIRNTAKSFFRVLFRGGDTELIQEYAYPLEYQSFIYVKLLFLLTGLLILYALLVFYFGGGNFSFFVPSLCVLYLGYGYIRTTPFPFLVILPLMAYDIFRNSKLKNVLLKTAIIPFLFLITFFGLQIYFSISKNWYAYTGVSSTEPGTGIANVHKSALADYILETYRDENLINGYGTGGLLIWKWYGNKKVFIDGRSIDYQIDFYNDYMKNYGLKTVEDLNLKRGLFALFYDQSWYGAYLTRNWNVAVFDTNLVIIERPDTDEFSASYGKIPVFTDKEEDVKKLQYYEKRRVGLFIRDTLKYMLFFGRLKDSMVFCENMKGVIACLDQEDREQLEKIETLFKDVSERFGEINDPDFSDLFVSLKDGFDSVKLNIGIAELYKKKGMLKEAVDFYSSIAGGIKDNIPVLLSIADTLFEMKAAVPAITVYEKVLMEQPGRVHEYNKIGYLYYVIGEKEKAVASFRKAVNNGPEVPESFINLAAILKEQGIIKEAKETISKGLSLHPDNKVLKSLLEGD